MVLGARVRAYRQVKMIVSQITSRIRSLHDQLLPVHRPARKRQLVAGAAPGRLVGAGDVDRRPAVRRRLVDGPGALARAHEGVAAVVAPGLGVAAVVEGAVVLVARLHGTGRVALLRPAARGLAAVPVAGRLAAARGALGRRGEEEGEEGDEGGERELHGCGCAERSESEKELRRLSEKRTMDISWPDREDQTSTGREKQE